MFRIALRNLLYDRMRMVAALTGVAFSVVLVTFQVGLFHRFIRGASAIIDEARAPLWITSPQVTNFEYGSLLDEKIYTQVLAIPGVGRAERLASLFAQVRLPSGAKEGIQVIGIDILKRPSIPWAFTAGSMDELRAPEAVTIDDTDFEKLGRPRLGEYLEINNRRARVVAVTHGHRSFITSPLFFMTLENAVRFMDRLQPGAFTYLLVTPEPGTPLEDVKAGLRRIPGIDVLEGRELAARSRSYWIFRTGAGFAIGLSAVLGFVVGMVIVGQTIYSSTMDRLKEFGTLKAIGADNGHLYRLIGIQALLYAVGGYILGMGASVGVAHLAAHLGSPIIISTPLVVAMFFITSAMCVLSSALSIARVVRLEPGMVFKS